MSVWRCTNSLCRQLFTKGQLGRDGKLLVCPDCGSMVCNITSTKLGQQFIAKRTYVPRVIRFQFMNKKLKTFDEGGQP